jgi:hypothetical protein
MIREDLVQATVRPAVSEGAVSDALVQLTFRVEPRAVHIVRGACTDIANIYHMRILEHVSNFDESQTAPLSQRQNETDSLRLQRDALLAALTEIIMEIEDFASRTRTDIHEVVGKKFLDEASAAITASKATEHWSDCAVHNEPALPKGDCNCDSAALTAASETGVGK